MGMRVGGAGVSGTDDSCSGYSSCARHPSPEQMTPEEMQTNTFKLRSFKFFGFYIMTTEWNKERRFVNLNPRPSLLE